MILPSLRPLWLVVFGLLASLAPHARPESAPPHVVLFLADDLGWAEVSEHGGAADTPHLDGMARAGVRLDRYYTAPICSPARAGLMTGRDPARYGMAYSVIRPWASFGLPPKQRTMAQVFQRSGYQTALVGKWHLGHAHLAHHPLQRGFDSFYGNLTGAVDYFTHKRFGAFDWQRNGETVRDKGYLTELTGEEAVRVVKTRDSNKPLFLVVSFQAPHDPADAPAGLIEKYKTRGVVGPRYAAMIEAMDRSIGKVLSALNDQGMRENSLLVFLSDNGAPSAYPWRNHPLSGGKKSVFEGGIRVPAVFCWPKQLPEGSLSSQRLSYLDVFPTVAEAAGIGLSAKLELDGDGLWNELRTDTMRDAKDLFFGAEDPLVVGQTVLSGSWKLIQYHHKVKDEDRVFLFDLAKDPSEETNLAQEHPEKTQELLKKIEQWQERHPPGSSRYTPEDPHPGWIPPRDWAIHGKRS